MEIHPDQKRLARSELRPRKPLLCSPCCMSVLCGGLDHVMPAGVRLLNVVWWGCRQHLDAFMEHAVARSGSESVPIPRVIQPSPSRSRMNVCYAVRPALTRTFPGTPKNSL
jgi:hypothetical protein